MFKPHILIIDDDPDLTAVMASVAASLGFEVAVCANMEELQSAYRSDLVAVIIDMVLPDIDGVEVIRWLAKQGSSAGMVLVSSADKKIITAGTKLIQERGLRLIGSLQKPFVPENLNALLNKARLSGTARHRQRDAILDLAGRTPAEDELLVLFQPKINMQTLDFCAVEALARWQHPVKGLLAPRYFIPAAEADGSIDVLTDMIVRKTLQHCNKWMKAGLLLEVSINISARTLGDVTFPDRLVALLQRYEVSPTQIVLEITETWLSDEPVECLDSLTRLSLKGFRLSIDDFGTGYSSISQLSRIPFGELKIDRSFVQQAPNNRQANRILESSVQLGHHLQLKVVAEGVETKEQWDLVNRLQCDECQGFFIARPLPGDSTPAWLKRWQTMQSDMRESGDNEHKTTENSALSY